MHSKFLSFFLLVFLFSLTGNAISSVPTYQFTDPNNLLKIDKGFLLYKDPSNRLSIGDMAGKSFHDHDNPLLNRGPTATGIWVKFSVHNATPREDLYLVVAQPVLDRVSLYSLDDNGQWNEKKLGKFKKYNERYIDNPNYIFPITIPQGTTEDFYLKINSKDQLQVPIYIGDRVAIYSWKSPKAIFFGVYVGIVLVMMTYHFFIFLSTRNQAYFFYVLFIFFVGLVQINFQGYAFKFLWPGSPWLALNSSFLLPMGSGLTTAWAVKKFLRTKQYVPHLDKGINVYIILCIVVTLMGLAGMETIAIASLQIIALLGAIYAIFIAYVCVVKMHHQPARFFLIAFVVFFICIIIFVLRNFDLFPYNLFTAYILEIGSVIQITLLAFALADQINLYRQEKEIAQDHAMRVLKRNERLVKEQNASLEREVKKRTAALRKSNKDLESVVYDLKQTQVQLIESEKQASIGILTAGLAHEINNPINFVTSNVRPLKRDIIQLFEALNRIETVYSSPFDTLNKKVEIEAIIQSLNSDYLKQEMNELLRGIEEGANRTAEIIKKLHLLSSAGIGDLKLYNINDSLKAAISVISNGFKDNIEVRLNFEEVPEIECYPEKLEQIFVHIFTNAVSAIHQKFSTGNGGMISVNTTFDENIIYVVIQDNGIGIDEEIKTKVFDPFFTTKDVGEGIGLGLPIVYWAVFMHQGKITINSDKGSGTELIIQLPRYHDKKNNQT